MLFYGKLSLLKLSPDAWAAGNEGVGGHFALVSVCMCIQGGFGGQNEKCMLWGALAGVRLNYQP